MEVILRQAVEKLGHPGDIVKVSRGLRPQLSCSRAASPTRRRPATRSGSSRSGSASRQAEEAAPRLSAGVRRRSSSRSRSLSRRASATKASCSARSLGRHRAAARAEQGSHDREAPDRPARADQGARRLPGADPAARRRAPRDQGLGHQAVSCPRIGLAERWPRSSTRPGLFAFEHVACEMRVVRL